MKRLLLIFSLLAIAFEVVAQSGKNTLEIDQSSFRPVQTDALSGVAIDPIGLDRSKRPCARVKMHINRMTRDEIANLEVRLPGGNVVLMKKTVAVEGNGLIFELTAKEQTRFYLHHEKYGDSNEVTVNLEPNKEYRIDAQLNLLFSITVASNTNDAEVYVDDVFKGRTANGQVLTIEEVLPGEHTLKLQYGSSVKEQRINVNSGSIYFRQEVDIAGMQPQFVIFAVQPVTAVVVLDGEILPLDEGGAAFKSLKQGTYNYRVDAKDYHSESGTIVVGGTEVRKIIELKPAFGSLRVLGESAAGASVYVDNKLIGTAPIQDFRLSSGSHSVQIVKAKYKSYSAEVTISDSQTTTIIPSLEANFAQVALTVADGAEIWINNKNMGTGSWRGELGLGSYCVECRKEGYKSSVQSVDVVTSTPLTKTLIPPTPIYGNISIVSNPLMATIKVDGKVVGETPKSLSNILIGQHTVEISKSGYNAWRKDITITEGQTASVSATLTKVATATPATSTSTSTSSLSGKFDGFDMVFVKGGTFTMGATSEYDADDDEKPTHSVILSDYYIGKYEVTQAQWVSVMGGNPSFFKGDHLPVENISWDAIQTFIQKLNAKTGKKYRLPTEAEWEYAARGGNQSRGYKYSGSNDIGSVAWYTSNSSGQTHPVGQKQPNELGIYDMSGNAWEWCSDWYGSYSSSFQTNPTGPSSGSYRVLRGGSWRSLACDCRVSNRHYDNPLYRVSNFGFRLVLLP